MVSWVRAKLGDLVTTQKGYAFKSGWYCDAGTPIVKVSDFTDDSVDPGALVCIPESVAADYLKYALRAGDVVVQTVGSWPTNPASVVGKCVRIPAAVAGSLLNQNAVKVTSGDGLDGKFLYYLLRNDDFKTYIIGTAQGAASQAAITLDAIRGYAFDLPPLTVQERMAGILSAYDELIESSQRRIKILESMARALYREWFVHFRFPGHESVSRVPSPFGEIPQGWEVTTLGRLVEIRKGKNITKDTIRDGDVPVVAGGITPAYFHDAANTQSPVITISASGANAGFVNLYHVDVWASDCSYVDMTATPHVFYYYLWLDHRRAAVTHLQRGSAQPHVYPKDLALLEALRAPENLLNAFTSQAEPIFALMMRLTAKVENLRRTRDLLLPRLLSGQIEVEAA